jgi:hypothetical protein
MPIYSASKPKIIHPEFTVGDLCSAFSVRVLFIMLLYVKWSLLSLLHKNNNLRIPVQRYLHNLNILSEEIMPVYSQAVGVTSETDTITQYSASVVTG